MKKLLCGFVILVCSSANAQLYIGQSAPDFSLPGTNDSLVSLSSLKGKVVLIDFWASWCGPCRASNPAVVKLYKKYRDAGFEVFGVSLDTKKAKWMKAIKQDKITYTQVIDEAGWYSKIAERYFVDQIPTSFLLDRSGKIVDIDSEGKELEKKVVMLLKE